MHLRNSIFGLLFFSAFLQASPSISFSGSDVSFSDSLGGALVWWHGRANFSGQVIAPACSLAMEDRYQSIDMGSTPVRDLQNTLLGAEKKIELLLRDCELSGESSTAKTFTGTRVRLTFEGVRGNTPDEFSLSGQASGVNLQIRDVQGYSAYSGKPMPPQLLTGNEQGLIYSLRLVRNGEPLKAGDYHVALRFKIDYE